MHDKQRLWFASARWNSARLTFEWPGQGSLDGEFAPLTQKRTMFVVPRYLCGLGYCVRSGF